MHMGTRWYRPPEIALCERQYDQASDMWSFGCILFEMLKFTTRDSQISTDEFKKERYLFKGTSCYPLTPIKKPDGEVSNFVEY